jgi:hypothetical protein
MRWHWQFCSATGVVVPPLSNLTSSLKSYVTGKQLMQWRAEGDLALTFRLEPPRTSEEECAVEGFDTYALTLVARKNGEEAVKKVELGQLRRNVAKPILLTTTFPGCFGRDR